MTCPGLPDRLRVRALRRADALLLDDLVARVSPRSMLLRFHAPTRELPAAYRAAVREAAPGEHWVAVSGAAEAPLALLDLVPVAGDPRRRELALLVVDRWQEHGVGRRLLDHALAAAAAQGVSRVTASVLDDQRPLLGALDRRLALLSAERAAGTARATYALTFPQAGA